MWFKVILGLRINLNKSEIYPMENAVDVEALALELGCKVRALPSSYLGLPSSYGNNNTFPKGEDHAHLKHSL